jgi:arsenite methyltransferase
METKDIKQIVKEKYSQIAKLNVLGQTACCSCCTGVEGEDSLDLHEVNDQAEGYVVEADLGLGCGLPTTYAAIKAGDTVVDLGSGAGNDAFVVASLVGAEGCVIGVDMTPEIQTG